jgi:hypothetical protein
MKSFHLYGAWSVALVLAGVRYLHLYFLLLQLHGLWPSDLFQFRFAGSMNIFRHLIGLLMGDRPMARFLLTHNNTERWQTSMPGMGFDPSVSTVIGITYLRPPGHCYRPYFFSYYEWVECGVILWNRGMTWSSFLKQVTAGNMIRPTCFRIISRYWNTRQAAW